MTRNLMKALGVIAAAALAMSAVFASAAQAETAKEFKSGKTGGDPEHTTSTLHGVQEGEEANNFFQVGGPEGDKITCTNSGVTFAGNTDADGTNSLLTMTPTYEECWQVGTTRNVTVDTNGCDYTFTQPTELADGKITGEAELHCPEGKTIEVTVFSSFVQTHEGSHGTQLCNITVSPVVSTTDTTPATEQKLHGHVMYTNLTDHEVTEGVKNDAVTVNATIEGIYWKKHGLCGSAEGHDGVYNNQVIVTGSAGAEKHHDVWIG